MKSKTDHAVIVSAIKASIALRLFAGYDLNYVEMDTLSDMTHIHTV